jgi:hypothetical protein
LLTGTTHAQAHTVRMIEEVSKMRECSSLLHLLGGAGREHLRRQMVCAEPAQPACANPRR